MESGLPASQAACTVGMEQTLYTWRMTFSSHSLQHDINGVDTMTVTHVNTVTHINAAGVLLITDVPEGCSAGVFIRYGCIQNCLCGCTCAVNV